MTREHLRIALLGNFRHSHTTENEYRDAFERCGHTVLQYQEGDIPRVTALCDDVRSSAAGIDVVVWIRTPTLAREMGDGLQWRLIAECNKRNVPLVGVHLDRWWGLEREPMLFTDAYFRVDLLCTADGGHDDDWEAAGINHRWLLPAISERWCQPGKFQSQLECDVLFVGSWKRYHDAWEHRTDMIQELSKAYGNRFRVAPKHGQARVIEMALNDYYWSAKVVVGDSCLVPRTDGSPMINYCSDRVPESLGRGAIFVHPRVEGLPFEFVEWELGDWGGMRKRIKTLLAVSDEERTAMRLASIDKIKAEHTYTHRVPRLIDIIHEEGLL